MENEYIKTGRTQQKIETRSKILKTAQAFLNQGITFNLEDIAKKTGISRATVYRYYSNVDVLATEAALDVSTMSPEKICKNGSGVTLEEKALEIQNYYYTLTVNHEKLFRKYLGSVIDANNRNHKRGARRKKTLELILKDTAYTAKEKEDLSNILTLFMGIEPMIVTKDVCGLNNQESEELLSWGLSMLLKGFLASKKP